MQKFEIHAYMQSSSFWEMCVVDKLHGLGKAKASSQELSLGHPITTTAGGRDPSAEPTLLPRLLVSRKSELETKPGHEPKHPSTGQQASQGCPKCCTNRLPLWPWHCWQVQQWSWRLSLCVGPPAAPS